MRPLQVRYIRDFQDFWACQRPMTSHWGSGEVWERICKVMGKPDVAFGKTDGIPDGGGVTVVDKNTGYDWKKLPFKENQFEFGYWDPPYDSYYKHEGLEIYRTVKRIAILHTGIWPWAWLNGVAPTEREHLIAVTMGPLKAIRALQVFRKTNVEQVEDSSKRPICLIPSSKIIHGNGYQDGRRQPQGHGSGQQDEDDGRTRSP